MLRAAHDLKSLLTVVVGYCDLAEQKADPSYIPKIREAALRCRDVINGAALASCDFALNVLVAETLDLLAPELEARGIAFQFRRHPEALIVAGYPLDIFRALLNLCTNARDAMPEGGRLILSTGAQYITPGRKFAVISAIDTGDGMTPRFVADIWTRKSDDPAHGHGLHIVKTAVEKIGGHVAIKSEIGIGTTVTLFLPIAAA